MSNPRRRKRVISVEWTLKRFDELTLEELYESMRLRVNVFVVEQHCPYPELDGVDYRSLHLLGIDDGRLVAYLRLFQRPDEEGTAQLGRIVTAERGKGYGAELLRRGILAAAEELRCDEIYIEAQSYAEGFYARAGFSVCSEEFLEDGIPHVRMHLHIKDSELTK